VSLEAPSDARAPGRPDSRGIAGGQPAADGDARTCDLCGSQDRMVIGRIGRDLRPLVNVVCRRCGLMRQDPLPSEAQLTEYYAKKYRLSYKGSAEPRRHDLERDRERAQARLALLEPILKPGMRILDVGSGTGTFLLHASQRGYAVHGIEPDAQYAARLTGQFKLPVHSGPWYTAPFPPGSFDLVVVHHVLEHLRHPTEALRRFHQWSAPDACLYLSVPNIKNPVASPLNRYQPAHLYGFSHETLVMTALKAGYAPLDLPNTGDTQMVFRRLPAPPDDWFIYPRHGEEMVEFFKNHTMLKFLMRPVAYRRILRHIKRGLFER
jgi:SAM-dependent methyltransferase